MIRKLTLVLTLIFPCLTIFGGVDGSKVREGHTYEFVRLKNGMSVQLNDNDCAYVIGFTGGGGDLLLQTEGNRTYQYPADSWGLFVGYQDIAAAGTLTAATEVSEVITLAIERANEKEFYESLSTHEPGSIELGAGDVATIASYSSRITLDTVIQTETDSNASYSYPLFPQSSSGPGGLNENTSVVECDQHFVGPSTIVSDGIKGDGIVTFRILRASDTGSKTLAWNGDTWEGGNDGTQQANNSNSPVPNPAQIQYDQLLGWCWFTQYPWVYSYTNGSWYYLKSTSTGLYAWNANLPGSKWIKIFG
jgi:hypothetical protein